RAGSGRFHRAWTISVDPANQVRDTYTCFGNIKKVAGNNFEWQISDIENDDGGTYPQITTVIDLRALIEASFKSKFTTPTK
ncbi:MAG: hypothetical protein KF891_24125, partial [Rhizobacter sp.]|nr:hypothetical protein [Rhizobacter sp.]